MGRERLTANCPLPVLCYSSGNPLQRNCVVIRITEAAEIAPGEGVSEIPAQLQAGEANNLEMTVSYRNTAKVSTSHNHTCCPYF